MLCWSCFIISKLFVIEPKRTEKYVRHRVKNDAFEFVRNDWLTDSIWLCCVVLCNLAVLSHLITNQSQSYHQSCCLSLLVVSVCLYWQLKLMLFRPSNIQHLPFYSSIEMFLIRWLCYRPPRTNHNAPSYAENRLPLTKKARAMLTLDPAYNPRMPRVWISSRQTWKAPLPGGIFCPCTPARTQSKGNEINHDRAPDNPPATGMANFAFVIIYIYDSCDGLLVLNFWHHERAQRAPPWLPVPFPD